MAPITIIEEVAYLKGYKELQKKKRWDCLEKLDRIVIQLANHQVSIQNHNHKLLGMKVQELHVDGDVLLLYRYKNQGTELEILNLIDLTNHKELKDPTYQKQLKKKLKEGLSRESMITELEKLGKNYNWSRFDDRQIYSMLQRELHKKPKHTQVIDVPGAEYCPKCGMQLTDSGECPRCDIYDPELI